MESEQLTHLKEGETYRIGLPCGPTECFNLDGYLCCIYIEDGIKKATYLKEADDFYPMDPWFLEWGYIGGVCYAHKTNNVSFKLSVGLKMASAKKSAPPQPAPEQSGSPVGERNAMPEDEEPLRTEIPEWLQDCYKFKGELIAEFHDEDGQLKTYAFVPPNGWRKYDIDEWYFEWGDIAGGEYPKSIPQFIFEELVEQRKPEYERERKLGMAPQAPIEN